jgi:hypothetical protein
MDGAPEIEIVFGDIDHFRAQVDRFYRVHEDMRNARTLFSSASQKAQTLLAAGRRGCPAEALAQPYATASDSGIRFRHLGEELEGLHVAIRRLDALGESAGLTPDYRWRVTKSKAIYRRALTDLKEMRTVFVKQLGRQLAARGCRSSALLARASKQESDTEASTATATAPAQRPKKDATPVVRASTATFFVDNRACRDELRVFVDGTLLGEVKAKTRVAFQSPTGRHGLCLLGDDSRATCGDTGTQRYAFVYDGWSLTRHCDGGPVPAKK